MPLPTAKTPTVAGLAMRNVLIYGDPKVGKTTLAAQLRPETTLFLATEDGLSAIEAYSEPIRSWRQFLEKCAEIAAGGHHYDTIVIDTVDELARLCVEYVIDGLGAAAKMDTKQFLHASDFEFGKGWSAITEEFRLKLSKLCSLGYAVVFISHTKTGTVKDRTGLETTTYSPDVGAKGPRSWLLGYVDLIGYAHKVQTDEGETRVLRLQGLANVESGGRVAPERWPLLPDTVPLDAGAVNDLFDTVWGDAPATLSDVPPQGGPIKETAA